MDFRNLCCINNGTGLSVETVCPLYYMHRHSHRQMLLKKKLIIEEQLKKVNVKSRGPTLD